GIAERAGDLDRCVGRAVDQGAADAHSHGHLACTMKCHQCGESPIVKSRVVLGAVVNEADDLPLELGCYGDLTQHLRVCDKVSVEPSADAGHQRHSAS